MTMTPETPKEQAPAMSLPQPKSAPYTLADWATWDGRWELINGVAYDMTPAPSPGHQEISMALSIRIGTLLEEARHKTGGHCKVFAAPTDVFLDSGVVQLDLLVVCDPAKLSDRGVEGAPDLVVEILSPRTASKDTVRKRWTYEAAGVPEYLIVDPEEKVGLLLRLEAGRYEEAARIEWGAPMGLLGGTLTVTLG
jgi:Uma2 family endonuclease